MKRLCIVYLIFQFLLVACSQENEVFIRLASADTLLYHGFVESADSVLSGLVPKTVNDSACYFVLRAQTDYRLRKAPVIWQLNYSIDFYEKHPNNRKLAEAYYYKACSFFNSDSLPDEVFVLLKNAECLAENIPDYDLKGKINSAFAFANNTVGELEEALKYAKRELYCAEKFGCRRDIAYALIAVSSSFRDMGRNDSAVNYVQKCQNLIDEVSDKDKAYFYILMGECFMGNSSAVAEDYFLKSLKYQHLPRSYTGLAAIYKEKGDTLSWRQYCDSALINAWCKLKIDIYSDMSNVYYGHGNIDGLKKTSDSAFAKNLFQYSKRKLRP